MSRPVVAYASRLVFRRICGDDNVQALESISVDREFLALGQEIRTLPTMDCDSPMNDDSFFREEVDMILFDLTSAASLVFNELTTMPHLLSDIRRSTSYEITAISTNLERSKISYPVFSAIWVTRRMLIATFSTKLCCVRAKYIRPRASCQLDHELYF